MVRGGGPPPAHFEFRGLQLTATRARSMPSESVAATGSSLGPAGRDRPHRGQLQKLSYEVAGAHCLPRVRAPPARDVAVRNEV